MKSAGKARNNGLYRHIRTSKEIIRNLLNDSSKSLMIILPFMEEAICYCNNAKLTIESFSYLGQLNNYITLLIQPVRKFFRAGRSCFYSLFSL